jgi:hypothetical protein
MRFHEFDTMILQVDMPSHGLKTGDVGAVVEFVTAAGRTQALVTLASASVRPVGSNSRYRKRFRGLPGLVESESAHQSGIRRVCMSQSTWRNITTSKPTSRMRISVFPSLCP